MKPLLSAPFRRYYWNRRAEVKNMKVTVWNEFRHEKRSDEIREIYPDGMHEAIAAYLRRQPGLDVRTATLDEPEHGLTEEILKDTDVLSQIEDDIWLTKVHALLVGLSKVTTENFDLPAPGESAEAGAAGFWNRGSILRASRTAC